MALATDPNDEEEDFGTLKRSCRHKSAPVYNGKHLLYPLLATREDVAKYGVLGDVTLYKLAEPIRNTRTNRMHYLF